MVVVTLSDIGEMVHFLVRAFCIRMVGKTMPGFCQGNIESVGIFDDPLLSCLI